MAAVEALSRSGGRIAVPRPPVTAAWRACRISRAVAKRRSGTSAEIRRTWVNGSAADVEVPDLTPGTAYHWRARTIDDTDRTGPWVSFGGNAETDADFATSG